MSVIGSVGDQLQTGHSVLGGRFRCERRIKSQHGVETWLATDLQARPEGAGAVVLKRAAAVDLADGVAVRLEHEAEVLHRLAPIVRAPVTFAREGGHVYLVQPLVPGITLQERLTRGPLSVTSSLKVAIDILSVLQYAHDNGVLHRDVKPANVIVDEAEPVGQAVLIDFGFARSSSLAASLRDEQVGTVRYLAPEVAGLLPSPVDGRSDLYSTGIVLFECLAGEPPFAGADVGAVLQQHLSAPAPRLRALGIDVPQSLDAVIQRLLRKDPAERYQTAAAAVADLTAIDDRRQALTEPSFVARTAELAALTDLVEQAARGKGGLVLLEAESGGGKTRLLEELAQQSQPHAWILRGQGVEEAARRPFQLLEGVVTGLVDAARQRPGEAENLREAVGDRADALVSALPGLGPVLGREGTADLGPEAYGETRTIKALGALLDALPSAVPPDRPDAPAVVLLDDCQWADGPTLRLLADWQEGVGGSHDAGATRILVVAAFRTEEVPADHLLRAMHPVAAITLPRLEAGSVRSLAESMAGPLPEDALRTVSALSEGSPFMAAAVLRGLVESGALLHTGGRWVVDDERLADVQTSRQAAIFLTRRLELLAPGTVELLSVGAVLGKDFDLHLATDLCRQDAAEAAAGLASASRRRIVWVDETAGRARLLHDKLREALLARLDPAHRRRLHLRAAERIEATAPDRVFELAYHFDAAGEGPRALPYAIEAASRARAQHSLDVAAAHYRMALAACTEAGPEGTRAAVAEGLGDVLTLQGSYEEATAQLETAMALAGTDFTRAILGGKLGDVAFRRGDQRLAREHLERAVRQLNRRLPRRSPALVIALLVEVVVQVAHTLLPRFFVGRRPREGADREFLAIRLYSRLAYVYWFSAGKVPCAWVHLREMNLAERYPPSPELAQAYSEHAPVMTMAPWFSRGIAYARRSLAIRRDLGDLWGQGQSLNFYGVVLYAASRYRESIEQCREAIRLLDQTGDRWEANTAGWHVAFALYRLGELPEAKAVAEELYAAASAIGDDTAAGVSLSAWSRASAGQVPAALVRARLEERNDDAHTAAEVHVAEGVRLLGRGECDRAVAVLEEAAAIVKRAGLRQEYVAPVLPWLATAQRSQAEALSPYQANRRRALLRQAGWTARRGWRVARFYKNNAPHALRERGLVASLLGHDGRAHRLLRRSLAAAEAQGAGYEAALSRLALARVDRLTTDPERADEAVAASEAAVQVLLPPSTVDPEAEALAPVRPTGTPATLSLADRFSTLLDVGRHIASAPSPAAVFAAVRQAAATLLRVERVLVLDVDEAEDDSSSSGRLDGWSRTLVRRALATGRPVVLSEAGTTDPADSVVLSGLRSALCAPIYSEGRPVACLYVTHSQVADLFGDDEVQLIEFVAVLAGAALEHVAGTEARFRSLAQNSSDVITIVDPDLEILYQSSAVTRVFGLVADELVHTSLAAWIHPDDAAGVLDAVDGLVREGRDSCLVECRLRRRDGSWCDVETAITNLVDDPSVNGVVLNSRDVSDRKRAERELRLTLEREQDMRGRLQEVDKMKTDFLSSVSHELRTPLTSILGYLEMLADGAAGTLADRQVGILGIVDRNAQRLLILIEELLIMSRVESGTFRMSMGPVELGPLVEGALQAVLPGRAGRDLDVSIDVASDVETIEGDPDQLDRVLINLLSNAVKFTPDGGRVRVTVRADGPQVVIRVSDTGMGIPVADQARIFERFYRSSTTQHLAVPGTGLGLSITKAIIEEHGGRISIASEPGHGTEVTVRLPVARVPQVNQAAPAPVR
jgi:two-component system sensor kinase